MYRLDPNFSFQSQTINLYNATETELLNNFNGASKLFKNF